MRTLIVGRSWGSRREERDLAQTGEEPIMNRVMPGIPHQDYRVLAVKAANSIAKASGRSTPSTADYASGKARVDKMLVDRGVGVAIPGAHPGRVTR